MNPLMTSLEAVRASLATEDIDGYHRATEEFNDAAAALFRILRNSRKLV